MPRKEILNEEYLVNKVEAAQGFTRKLKWLGRRGAPDRFCGFPLQGKCAWVEVKEADQPYGLQPEQQREHLRLKAAGCEVWVLSTKHEIDTFIKEMVSG